MYFRDDARGYRLRRDSEALELLDKLEDALRRWHDGKRDTLALLARLRAMGVPGLAAGRRAARVTGRPAVRERERLRKLLERSRRRDEKGARR